MTWGLQIYRYMHGRGEDTAWVIWDRETRGFISRFGEIRDIRDIPPPRQLEVLPYVVQSLTDPSVIGAPDDLEHFQNVGADVKYGVTADLTLNATMQPDFGQIEADPAVLNLSPFETFYNEKRPFFIEGSRFFQHPNFNLFYSRRIGRRPIHWPNLADSECLDQPDNTSILGAFKLTGKTSDGLAIGILESVTAKEKAEIDPKEQWTS